MTYDGGSVSRLCVVFVSAQGPPHQLRRSEDQESGRWTAVQRPQSSEKDLEELAARIYEIRTARERLQRCRSASFDVIVDL